MKPFRILMPFVMALAVTAVTVPQASSQTPPPAPPAQQPPPAQEQQNTHPVAKGAAAGAAFGAAANATGAGKTTVVVNPRGSANRQAPPTKAKAQTGKSRR
jgi:hypothetical protein